MAKLSILEIVRVALLMSLILWHETSSSAVTVDPSVVTEETTTTTEGRVSDECDGVTCPAGKCAVIGENRTATCICPQRFCPRFVALVCGSDGKTYTNGCFLSNAACNTATNITIKHNGRCNDSCTGFNCPYYGRCVVDPDTDSPKCVCSPGCPRNLNPVCGSDNETYGNECMLQSKACEKKINITVARYGRCDGSSCDGKTCPPGKRCERNSEGEPTCRSICDTTVCTLQYDPVCGSDGRTYGNKCAFDAEACKNKNITVAHTGECETGCAGITCPNYGSCVFDDSQNRSMCVCRFGCPRIRRPVCGSDNQTYSNDCVLRSVSCETNTSITVLHKGECDNGGLGGCETVLCPPGKFCVPNDKSEPECVCQKVCPDIYRPVCGSDNVTYPNDCELLREACKTNTSITVIRHERCEDGGFRCDEITCPPGKSCDPNSGECHCDTACPDEEAPVCASNGKTYGNQCEFDVALCLYDNNGMTVVHNGTCGTES